MDYTSPFLKFKKKKAYRLYHNIKIKLIIDDRKFVVLVTIVFYRVVFQDHMRVLYIKYILVQLTPNYSCTQPKKKNTHTHTHTNTKNYSNNSLQKYSNHVSGLISLSVFNLWTFLFFSFFPWTKPSIEQYTRLFDQCFLLGGPTPIFFI